MVSSCWNTPAAMSPINYLTDYCRCVRLGLVACRFCICLLCLSGERQTLGTGSYPTASCLSVVLCCRAEWYTTTLSCWGFKLLAGGNWWLKHTTDMFP